jgi:hypothetical protein
MENEIKGSGDELQKKPTKAVRKPRKKRVTTPKKKAVKELEPTLDKPLDEPMKSPVDKAMDESLDSQYDEPLESDEGDPRGEIIKPYEPDEPMETPFDSSEDDPLLDNLVVDDTLPWNIKPAELSDEQTEVYFRKELEMLFNYLLESFDELDELHQKTNFRGRSRFKRSRKELGKILKKLNFLD